MSRLRSSAFFLQPFDVPQPTQAVLHWPAPPADQRPLVAPVQQMDGNTTSNMALRRDSYVSIHASCIHMICFSACRCEIFPAPGEITQKKTKEDE
ncbi:MAG: hypothetical protein DMG91_05490 [Acidobacteria bacterium]|nr:MAG: hypothetical protein DMG91_05490 [Acidobacteriota bacterium]